jgi:hypothetical protein
MALGSHATALSGGSAFGDGSYALGQGTVAIGAGAYADSAYSLAVGASAVGSGYYAVGVGGRAYNAYSWSGAWGYAQAEQSIAVGGNTYGFQSMAGLSGVSWSRGGVAIGRGTVAAQDFQVVLGLLNVDGRRSVNGNGYPQDTAPHPGDPIFVIGNGSFQHENDPAKYTETRSNAFTVGYDGAAWVQGGITVEGGSVASPAPSVFKHDVSVQGVLRVPESGDLSMGAFTDGTRP